MIIPFKNIFSKLSVCYKEALYHNIFEIPSDVNLIRTLNLNCGDRAWLWIKPDSIDVFIFCRGFGIAAEELGSITSRCLYNSVKKGYNEVIIERITESKIILKFCLPASDYKLNKMIFR